MQEKLEKIYLLIEKKSTTVQIFSKIWRISHTFLRLLSDFFKLGIFFQILLPSHNILDLIL